MLSNPLHRYSASAYHAAPGLTTNTSSSGLSTMDPSSQYSFQQLQHGSQSQQPPADALSPHSARPLSSGVRTRQFSYGGQVTTPAKITKSASGTPVRRRISRACDQCNQLRTKCDGQHPCAHCIEFGLTCEYIRERKKRGKVSRKDLAAQAAAQAAAQPDGSRSPHSSGDTLSPASSNEQPSGSRPAKRRMSIAEARRGSEVLASRPVGITEEALALQQQPQQHTGFQGLSELTPHMATHGIMERELTGSGGLDLSPYDAYDRQSLNAHMMGSSFGGTSALSSYPDLPYGLQTQSPSTYNTNPFNIRNGSLPSYLDTSGAAAEWLPIASPTTPAYPQAQMQPPPAPVYPPAPVPLRYPVLKPILSHIASILPQSLACDLLDLYFSSSSSAHIHPLSPYVLASVFRKRSFLTPSNPRPCQPALLASILWVAAQTSDAPLLTSPPSARGKVCQKLLELTVSLLRPLIHTPAPDPSSVPTFDPTNVAAALGSLGVALPGSISLKALSGESGAFGAAGTFDDVVTYIHLATVVSASEYKGASLRWWTAAWSLARELKLNRELPTDHRADDDDASRQRALEEREERRRIWWLVYIVDRHLALCYNRPLFLLDRECAGLKRPMDDAAWQAGDFTSGYTAPPTDPSLLGLSGETSRGVSGPTFECIGHSIFGYFLPLMAILGEVVDLHHARNHPRFGPTFSSSRDCDRHVEEITKHLEVYEHSLKSFASAQLAHHDDSKPDDALDAPTDANTPSVHSVHTSSSRLSENDIQTRIVLAYGTHVVHVLHILLSGKWDPLALLDDADLWISTQGFITATAHAVSAAEAISQILEYDPGLEFMPFFFGIYLLQGSFLLLLIADKLQMEASASVVRACETIIRAHEACVVTLNTEYQRNFSKVMRSALAQIRGRIPADLNEQHQRRRELLSLYRWAGDGTGLAL